MRQDFLNSCVEKLKRQRNISLVFGVGMLFTNILLGVGILHKAEKVILVPPEINKTFWVSSKTVDEVYLSEMSIFWANILLNTAHGTSEFRTKVILDYVAPSFYGDLSKRLVEQDKYMSENDITTSFYFKEATVDAKNKKVILTGILRNFIAASEVKKSLVSYELSFVHKGYRWLLKSFKSLDEEENG